MPARLSPRNRAKRGAKTAGAQSEDVPLFTRRRTGGEWVEVATLPHHQQAIAAQSREARCKNSRSAERCARRRVSERNRRRRHLAQSEDVPLFTRRRTGGEWVEVATLPPTNRLCRAIARSAVQKQPERRALRPQARFGAQPPQAALGAEIGCSSVYPPPNRRRMGGGDNLALLLGEQQTPHHRQQAIATPRKVGT